MQTHCYYHGEVEGYEDSMVALSTCSGLRSEKKILSWFVKKMVDCLFTFYTYHNLIIIIIDDEL